MKHHPLSVYTRRSGAPLRSKKHTAWRRNRKFGDVYGGRSRRKIANGIFNRAHSLSPPLSGQVTPIVIQDNPSRDYFFPLSAEECVEALRALPRGDFAGITHLWLRRPGGADRRGGLPLAEFICGSGVRLIVLYPWRSDRRLCLGRERPVGKVSKEFSRFGAAPFKHRGWWYAQFSGPELRRYCVHILYHEVGHHVDWYRRSWTAANVAQTEEAAEQYAVRFTEVGADVLSRYEGFDC